MKVEKDKLIESIKNLNKKKPLKEQADIQRVLPPADADAQEQHRQALEQNAKRKDPKNYDEAVKELIKETASEDSRYRHFDVVDRRDLAKKINEARCYGKVILSVEYDPFLDKDNNNYIEGCWQFRVYSPISIDNVKRIE